MYLWPQHSARIPSAWFDMNIKHLVSWLVIWALGRASSIRLYGARFDPWQRTVGQHLRFTRRPRQANVCLPIRSSIEHGVGWQIEQYWGFLIPINHHTGSDYGQWLQYELLCGSGRVSGYLVSYRVSKKTEPKPTVNIFVSSYASATKFLQRVPVQCWYCVQNFTRLAQLLLILWMEWQNYAFLR